MGFQNGHLTSGSTALTAQGLKNYLAILILALTLSACATSKLKRCGEPVEDESIQVCKEKAADNYYFCDEPENLMKCEEPR